MKWLDKKYKATIAATVMFFAGILIGHFWNIPVPANSGFIRENSSQFHFINPLLLMGDGSDQKSKEFENLNNSLESYIGEALRSKKAQNISVYLRDLNTGRWTGVNEDDKYNPASMLKIAVLIATLRLAETNPRLLDQKVTMSPETPDQNFGQFYPPKNPVVRGKVYTVRDLINSMIVESDNNASGLLIGLTGRSQYEKVLNDLHLPVDTSGTTDTMSPKIYSRLYRVLYNSSYLPHQLSEETLDLLVMNDFPQGLYAGIPSNMPVAQKFGERTITDIAGNPIERELHDCGIVYFPNHPYFLCVMTRGQDFKNLQTIIANISKKAWDEFGKIKISL